jgi:hypothetical protein
VRDETQGCEAADRLEAAAEEMLSEVARLPHELITWKPAEGVWSVMDILCHDEEFVPYWTAQAQQVVRDPDQIWGRDHTHEGRLAAVENTASRILSGVEASIRDAVRQSAETLRQLSDADFAAEAPSRNPRWGRKPVSFIVDDLLIQHVEKHVGQIKRNAAQYQERGTTGL